MKKTSIFLIITLMSCAKVASADNIFSRWLGGSETKEERAVRKFYEKERKDRLKAKRKAEREYMKKNKPLAKAAQRKTKEEQKFQKEKAQAKMKAEQARKMAEQVFDFSLEKKKSELIGDSSQ